MKNVFLLVILLLILACSQESPKSNNNASKDSMASNLPPKEVYWKGWLGDHQTVFIHYSAHDSIVIGEIEYLNPEKIKFPLMGSIQADSTYKLYEIDNKGIIHGYLKGYVADNTFHGSHFTIDKSKELKFILPPLDTTISLTSYKTDVKDIFGTYHYEYHYPNGKTHVHSDLTLEKTNDSLMHCYTSSEGSGSINSVGGLTLDSLNIFTAKDKTFVIRKYQFKIVFYKNMAFLLDAKDHEEDEYGDHSFLGKVITTKEGVFIKSK